MKCDRVRELASEALDDVLTADQSERYHAHLEHCLGCRSFHADLKEALLTLHELPVLEVGDRFDAAVWSRIRTEEESVGFGERLRRAFSDLAERVRVTPPLWKWSPVGVAAAVALFVAVTSGPVPIAPEGAPEIAATSPPAEVPPVATSSPARAAGTIRSTPSATAPGGASPSEPASHLLASAGRDAPVAETSGSDDSEEIPEAIERFLQRAESRSLSLEGDPDRFRRSNYSYPLRRVPDPRSFSGAGSVPVSGPHPQPSSTVLSPSGRGPILPVAQPVAGRSQVVAF